MAAQDEDCYRWNNAADVLCYGCDSCKAGVLEQVRRDWHKLSVLNVVILMFLIGIYSVGCCAFRNARRAESEYPFGENRMSKVHPRWDYFWYQSFLPPLTEFGSARNEICKRVIPFASFSSQEQILKQSFCYGAGGGGGETEESSSTSGAAFSLLQ
ncbi:hypothetical protein BHE74_00029145 [Ensete ventricosum]|nr:hypothetical protein BHE74_00029145 [Ensete ventricosum]RZS27282.1 hypothetical protein BHM03_00060728 [Ensete ventricosum]